MAGVSPSHISDLQGKAVNWATREGVPGGGRGGMPGGGEAPPRPLKAAAPTLSLGGVEAGGLAPVTPRALVALLLRHRILQCGHLDTQPGLIGGTRVQFSGFKFEPGHPNDVILVPSPLWGGEQFGGAGGETGPISPRGRVHTAWAHLHVSTDLHVSTCMTTHPHTHTL